MLLREATSAARQSEVRTSSGSAGFLVPYLRPPTAVTVGVDAVPCTRIPGSKSWRLIVQSSRGGL